MIIQAKDFTKNLVEGKKLISFDADGTLVESKTKMSPTMVLLFNSLLEKYFVNSISGGKYAIFKENILEEITPNPELLKKLTLSPTCGAVMYIYDNEWKEAYKDALEPEIVTKILEALNYAIKSVRHAPEQLYGDMIENRETQVTFSAYGQKAPLELKNTWDPNQEKRREMIKYIDEKLDNLDIKIGGTTSIDITKVGINKGYGIKKLAEYYNITLDEILFVGDALFEGGNDKPVSDVGVTSIQVKDVKECEKVIKQIIS